jgi:NADPH:quinone reductase-like Zn-dependent oxidoreductase
MKAAVVYEAGGPDKLVVTEVAKPAVKDGWSLVKVTWVLQSVDCLKKLVTK